MIFNKFRSFNFILSIIFIISSCSSKPIDSKKQSRLDEMENIPRFGFLSKGHKYIFTLDKTEGFKNDCSRFNVYKDTVLINSFSSDRINELSEIYKSNSSIENKIASILKFIKKLPEPFYSCQKKSPENNSTLKKIDTALAEVLSVMIYGTIFVIGSPITVPSMISYYVNDIKINANLKKINFGDTPSDIRKIFQTDYKEENTDNNLVHIYNLNSGYYDLKLVFVYEDKKLVAYVWGFYNL